MIIRYVCFLGLASLVLLLISALLTLLGHCSPGHWPMLTLFIFIVRIVMATISIAMIIIINDDDSSWPFSTNVNHLNQPGLYQISQPAMARHYIKHANDLYLTQGTPSWLHLPSLHLPVGRHETITPMWYFLISLTTLRAPSWNQVLFMYPLFNYYRHEARNSKKYFYAIS